MDMAKGDEDDDDLMWLCVLWRFVIEVQVNGSLKDGVMVTLTCIT